jgi:drug/metabolite transporter (DMT)-like permease
MNRKTISPYVGLFLGIAAVSTASLFIRLAQEEAPSLVIAAGRLLIASLVIVPFSWKNMRTELPRQPKSNILLLMLSGILLGLHFAAWITSLEYTSISSSVVIVTTAPLWVAIFSPIFLKEKITKWVILGLGVSLFGSTIVALNSACHFSSGQLVCEPIFSISSNRMVIGDILALFGAFFSAGYLMIGRRVRNAVSLSSYTATVYSVATIVLITMVIFSKDQIIHYSNQTYLWILALALIPQLIGHSSFNWALKYLSAAMVSIALLGEPIGTIILAYLILKESPTMLEIVGGALILTGIIVASKSRRETPLIPET